MKISIPTSFLITLLFPFSMQAQGPVLDSTVAITVGQNASINVINNALNIPSGNAGASQIYDYSALPSFNSNYEILGIDNLTSPYATTYADANATVSWSSFGSPYYHFLLSDTSYIYLGGGGSFGQYEYLDVYEQLRFPFAYTDTYTDTFVAVSNTGGYRAGSVTVSGDGYGDLLVPGSTFNNVLRVKRESAYYDTVSGTPRFTQETYYEYYKPGIPHYILLHGFYTITSGSSNPLSGSQLFYNSGALVSSDNIQNIPNTTCQIIHQNAHSTLRIKEVQNYNSMLQLFNLQGQLIWNKQLQIRADVNEIILPSDMLQNGMYLLQFNNAAGKPVVLKWSKAD